MSQRAGDRKAKGMPGEPLQRRLLSLLDGEVAIYVSFFFFFLHPVRLWVKQWWGEVMCGRMGRLPNQVAASQSSRFVSGMGFSSPPASSCLPGEKTLSGSDTGLLWGWDGPWMASSEVPSGCHLWTPCLYMPPACMFFINITLPASNAFQVLTKEVSTNPARNCCVLSSFYWLGNWGTERWWLLFWWDTHERGWICPALIPHLGNEDDTNLPSPSHMDCFRL